MQRGGGWRRERRDAGARTGTLLQRSLRVPQREPVAEKLLRLAGDAEGEVHLPSVPDRRLLGAGQPAPLVLDVAGEAHDGLVHNRRAARPPGRGAALKEGPERQRGDGDAVRALRGRAPRKHHQKCSVQNGADHRAGSSRPARGSWVRSAGPKIPSRTAPIPTGSASTSRSLWTRMTSERRGGRVRRVDAARRRREQTPYDRPQSKGARRRDSARQRVTGPQAAAVASPARESVQPSPSAGRRSVLGGITTFVSSLIFGSPTQRRGPGAAASSPAWKVSPSSFRFSVGNGSPGTPAPPPRTRLPRARAAAHTFRALSSAPRAAPAPHPQPRTTPAPDTARKALPHPIRATPRPKRESATRL